MNLIEAVKSGKRFKQEKAIHWISKSENKFIWHASHGDETYHLPFTPNEVLAEDYILEEPQPKIITWYRPAIIWNMKTKEYDNEIYASWRKDKSHEYADNCIRIVKWDECELPEEWKV